MHRPYLYSATGSYPTLDLRARCFGYGKYPLSRKRSVSYFIRITAPPHRGSDNPREETYMEKEKGNNRGRGEVKEAFARHK